jgi:hypothetical protein
MNKKYIVLFLTLFCFITDQTAFGMEEKNKEVITKVPVNDSVG